MDGVQRPRKRCARARATIRLPPMRSLISPSLLLAALLAGCAATAPSPQVELRLIAFNDFHGHLETQPMGFTLPDAGGQRRLAAGGAAVLAAAIGELKKGHAHTAVVAAGDLISGSPLVSSLFHDEPAVRALDAVGLELTSLGNHEFDRGREELLRLQNGGCHPKEGCVDGPFTGAKFRWLGANVFDQATGRTLLPAYVIREYDVSPVAFVGAVLKGTPAIVSRAGITGLQFRDEAESVNALVPELRAKGVEAIVLLIHQGGQSQGAFDDASCPAFQGAIVDIVKRLDKAVDVVVSGHTHQAYLCRVDGRPVTSALSFGRVLTTIDLTLDRATRDISASRFANTLVTPERFTPDANVAKLVERYVELAKPKAQRPVGRVMGEFTPVTNASGESNLGSLVADAQLTATRAAGAQVAFMNPGGLRAPLAAMSGGEVVTFADIYRVQPFSNTLVTMTLTGRQLMRVLEQQWLRGSGAGDRPRLLQVSEGFGYEWDSSKPPGARVVPGSVRIDGKPIELTERYRITANSFLADGGDGFTLLREGTERTVGMLDVASMEEYLKTRVPEAKPPEGRIRRVGPQ